MDLIYKKQQNSMKIGLLGIPLDLGANVQGSREDPDRIREFLIPLLEKKEITYQDFGNVLLEF